MSTFSKQFWVSCCFIHVFPLMSKKNEPAKRYLNPGIESMLPVAVVGRGGWIHLDK